MENCGKKPITPFLRNQSYLTPIYRGFYYVWGKIGGKLGEKKKIVAISRYHFPKKEIIKTIIIIAHLN